MYGGYLGLHCVQISHQKLSIWMSSAPKKVIFSIWTISGFSKTLGERTVEPFGEKGIFFESLADSLSKKTTVLRAVGLKSRVADSLSKLKEH